ncbi:MAG: spore photoproduct lyase [Bacillota bacterium]|nr:spore photoproduct lyase [Bacillota bacterium]
MAFEPEAVFVRERALDWPRGREILAHFRHKEIPVTVLGPRERIPVPPLEGPRRGYIRAKRTLVVTTVNAARFLPSKPSADYQLPLSSGCPSFCEYCYLQTTLGKRPYVQVYVNLEEILSRARAYLDEAGGRIRTFEGSCTSDPLPVEPYTRALRDVITFFASRPNGRFRFVTKYTDVGPLTRLAHNGHTRFRFSINTDRVVRAYEHGTPPVPQRLAALRLILEAGYPSGFIVAPLFLEGDWKSDYEALFHLIRQTCGDLRGADFTFELITHRFTDRAKATILEMFPHTSLPLDPGRRQYRRGQFGYGKYLYPRDVLKEAEVLFEDLIGRLFPGARLDYFV